MDLVSASTEKLEPFPGASTKHPSSSDKEEEKWMEDVTEKAERGEFGEHAIVGPKGLIRAG